LTFDLIHSNSSIFDIGLFLSKKFNIPHVWHVREYLQSYDYDYIYGRKTIINKYKDSDVIIAISDNIESYIKGLNKEINVRKIHNGIVLPKAYRKEYCIGNIVRFCIVGAVQLHKNQMDVIKAADCLIKRGYREFEIYIVGDIGGDYYNQISKYLSDKEELLKRVIFTGYCDNVIEFLKDKDVGIMASDMEAFGRVTIEYMANYMPVIGTNTGGTVELIKDVGILYEPHDVEALAEAMRSYVENPEKLQYSCNAVRNRAEIYDADTNAKLVFETYRELI
jgi:glycosyltransferase involved in cell wall biosynthesis